MNNAPAFLYRPFCFVILAAGMWRRLETVSATNVL